MVNRTTRLKVNKIVAVLLAVGLIFNLVSDFWAYQTFIETNASGEEVVRASKAETLLQEIDREIGMHRTGSSPNIINPKVLSNADALHELIEDDQKQKLLFSTLQNHLSTAKSNEQIESVLDNMILNQAERLQNVIAADRAVNKVLQADYMRAITIDVILLLILGGLFWVENRNRQIIETNLNLANESFKKLNLALEARLSSQVEKNKIMIHDLKNPLGTIRGFAELILDENPDSATIQEFSAAIRGSSERTLRLVDSLLLSDGTSEREEEYSHKVDVIPLLRSIGEEFSLKTKIKSQTLNLDFNVNHAIILGSAGRIQNLMENLIGNAIKYSPSNSVIQIRGYVNSSNLHIEVQDQGPGFSEADKINAFHFGQTLSAKSTSGESSTGFGLFSCKQIVEAHHGAIEILDAKAGPGAVVSVTLPLLMS